MKLNVLFTPGEIEPGALGGRTAVVIDVLRATSTMVEALANGARAVYPRETTEAALELRQNLDREDLLLCGERRGRRIEGFDLGNSPAEYTPERVRDHALIMTTTNGTAAILAAGQADRAFVGSVLNLTAVADAVVEAGEPTTILCAAREGAFALEDALCAGMIVMRLESTVEDPLELSDAAIAARALAERWRTEIERAMRATQASRDLTEVGHGDDVAFCAQVDRHRAVPELRDRQLVLP